MRCRIEDFEVRKRSLANPFIDLRRSIEEPDRARNSSASGMRRAQDDARHEFIQAPRGCRGARGRQPLAMFETVRPLLADLVCLPRNALRVRFVTDLGAPA